MARVASGLAVGLVIGFAAAWVGMAVYQLVTGQLVHPMGPGPEPIMHHHHYWLGP